MKSFKVWVILLMLSACGQAKQTNYQLYTVSAGNLELTVPETGELGSAHETSVTAPFAGTLSQLLPEGSVLKKGQTLGRIETTSQEQERKNSQLSLTEAQIDIKLADIDQNQRLQENHYKQDVANLDVRLETLRLRKLKEERDQVALTRVQEGLRSLKQQMEILELQARENKRLFGLGYLSREESEQAQLQLNEAKEQTKQLQAELTVLKAGPRPQEIGLQMLALQRTHDEQMRIKQELKAQQRVAEVQKRSATTRITKYKQRYGYYNSLVQAGALVAPAAGTLIYGKLTVGEDEVPIKSGDALEEGVQVARLVDLQQPVVRLMIHEIDAPRVKVGQAVRLAFDTFPEVSFQGKVQRLLPVARQLLSDQQKLRAFSCEIQLLRQDPRLKPGMTAQVEIITRRIEKILMVPTQAIVSSGSESWCWVMGPGQQPQRRKVEIGASDATMTHIRRGLQAGDKIVLSPLPQASASPTAVASATQASPVGSATPLPPAPAESKPAAVSAEPSATASPSPHHRRHRKKPE